MFAVHENLLMGRELENPGLWGLATEPPEGPVCRLNGPGGDLVNKFG